MSEVDLRRLRVCAHFVSPWVFEIAGLIAAVTLIAELVMPS